LHEDKGKGFKLKEGRFQTRYKEEIFYAEGGQTLAQVAPSLETFKVRLVGALSNLI